MCTSSIFLFIHITLLGSGGGMADQETRVKKFKFFYTRKNNMSDVK